MGPETLDLDPETYILPVGGPRNEGSKQALLSTLAGQRGLRHPGLRSLWNPSKCH